MKCKCGHNKNIHHTTCSSKECDVLGICMTPGCDCEQFTPSGYKTETFSRTAGEGTTPYIEEKGCGKLYGKLQTTCIGSQLCPSCSNNSHARVQTIDKEPDESSRSITSNSDSGSQTLSDKIEGYTLPPVENLEGTDCRKIRVEDVKEFIKKLKKDILNIPLSELELWENTDKFKHVINNRIEKLAGDDLI